MANKHDAFKPGDTVPGSGINDVSNVNMNSVYPQSSESNDSRPIICLDAEAKGVSRRDFLATCSCMTALLGLPVEAVGQAYAKNRDAEFGKSNDLNRESINREEPNMPNGSDTFQPGDTVPASGIYDVIHDKLDGQEHTDSHQVIAIGGKVFPPCRGCQTWVRFRLYLAAEPIEAHAHFKG